MAQQHKAATQVTIASTDDSPLHDFVQRYWKLGALFSALLIAAVLGRELLVKSAENARTGSWNRLREDVDFGTGIFASIQLPSAGTLRTLADEIQDSPAGPWARALEVQKLIADADYYAASDALQKLQEEYPNHALVRGAYRFKEGGPVEELWRHLLSRMDAVNRWEQEHKSLFENPPPPADCPRVRLSTSKGEIVLGLYAERAPKHVENFLKLCGEGFYDDILFHRIGREFMIQGGDPNTRDNPDKTSWGQGGPGYKIPQEPSDLRHFRYALAAAKTAVDVESSGSQFYITVGSPHQLDGTYTIFGTVLEGKTVVDEIAAGEIEAGQVDRPRDPVVIRSAEVVK
jgi:cyclophilin family peptidyl-prolyl cis-trans isomerase